MASTIYIGISEHCLNNLLPVLSSLCTLAYLILKNKQSAAKNMKNNEDPPTVDYATPEERTAILENELVKSKNIIESMAGNFSDGCMCIVNKEMKYVFSGSKSMNEIGLKNKGAGASFYDDLPAVSKFQEQIKRTFQGLTGSFEMSIKDKIYNFTTIPIRDAKNEIAEILIVLKNISAQKLLEFNLVKALEKEKEFNVLKSQFVTLASHELRTPLTTILSSVFLLENTPNEQEKIRTEYLEKIKRAVHHITDILNDFLSLGKLEEGRVKVTPGELDIKVFLEEFLDEVESIKKAGQKIVFTYAGKNPDIVTDKVLLKNILVNLLSNAIKYSGNEGEIKLEVEHKDRSLKFKVIDHGIGIPEHERHQVLKRFYRGENASSVQGTGLGLNIVKKYVRLLKGSIEFTSEINKGTTFTVVIPLNNV